MPATIIDGSALAEAVKDKIVAEIVRLNQGGRQCLDCHPNLAIVLVGAKKDSELYVDKKLSAARLIGVDTHLYKCEEDLGQAKLLEMIGFLNKDETIDAIMVQLPLPGCLGYDTDEIIRAIDPEKDVDRFHPANIGPVRDTCGARLILPPVFGAILEMLGSIGFGLEGKIATIVSKSEVFGVSLAKCLSCRGALARAVKPDADDLSARCQEAELLIPVVGRPGAITPGMIRQGAVVIDVGITRDQGSVRGDVDFGACLEKAGYISPVPGGVGPLTVAMTLKNTLELYKRRRGK